jgi:hypothetical protein
MPIVDERFSQSPAHLRLCELARQTKRYSICDVEPGRFEVIDNRYRVDHLLQFPELWPTKYNLDRVEFDELLEALSEGPTMNLHDFLMLDWLLMRADELDPKGQNTAFNAAEEGAIVVRGTFRQAEYFLLAALNHRVQ